MTQAIVYKIHANCLVVQFNRPEIRNPLSVFVLEQLHKMVDESSGRNIIFTGTGASFASGADLREINALIGEKAREFALYGQSLMNKIEGVNAIAAVNGFCFGGALDLALACRLRIAAPGAQFSHPGANLGIMTGWGGTQRLPRLIGQSAALEMFYTAKRVSADEALKIGLIDRISINPLETALELLAE